VGCLYAAARPEKVSKLILIEALGPLSEKPDATASRLQEALQKRRALDDKSMPVYADFGQALQRRASVANIEAELIKPIVERGLKGSAKGYTWRSDPRLRTGSMMRYSEAQVVSALQAIEARVLLIEGDKGYFQANTLAEVRKQHIRHLVQIQLSGGHHLHLENPRQIGEIIDKFVADS
jgi:pimeloyl-ACP methyl ester carboxylesterase